MSSWWWLASWWGVDLRLKPQGLLGVTFHYLTTCWVSQIPSFSWLQATSLGFLLGWYCWWFRNPMPYNHRLDGASKPVVDNGISTTFPSTGDVETGVLNHQPFPFNSPKTGGTTGFFQKKTRPGNFTNSSTGRTFPPLKFRLPPRSLTARHWKFTLPKTNMDTQSDGVPYLRPKMLGKVAMSELIILLGRSFEKVTPFK